MAATLGESESWSQSDLVDAWAALGSTSPWLITDWDFGAAWTGLRAVAAQGAARVSRSKLSEAIAGGRIPDEFAFRELGRSGPVVGTIHASKGREADEVLLSVVDTDEEQITGDEEAQGTLRWLKSSSQEAACPPRFSILL